MRGVIAALLLWTLAAAPQQTGQNTPPEGKGTAKIAVSTQLVVETVIVKDKNGNPIEGLTAKDFIITEDGKPQAIAFCEYQKLKDVEATPPTFATRPENDIAKAVSATVEKVDKVTRGQIA